MAGLSPRQVFQPSCPRGGSWTACGFGSRFVGCCLEASSACINDCSAEDLKPASFAKDRYLDVSGSVCPDDALWYTCQSTIPTFMGCCTSNPCQQHGCPAADLRAAHLSTDEAEAEPYSAILGPEQTASKSAASPSSSSPRSPASSSAATASAPSSTPHTDTPALVGGVIGGVAAAVFLASLAIAFFFLLRRRRRLRRQLQPEPTSPQTDDKQSPVSPSNHDAPLSPAPCYSAPSIIHPSPEVQELDTAPPPPRLWHTSPRAHAFEMSSTRPKEDSRSEGNDNGLRRYGVFAPAGRGAEGGGRYEIGDRGKDVSYELHG
ncbi:MAG: hypothetical protein LQ345_006661 [Seirophora villosa]|nr:MAG: hypothetical protein LQ345_006661 [Seirophora villosa]